MIENNADNIFSRSAYLYRDVNIKLQRFPSLLIIFLKKLFSIFLSAERQKENNGIAQDYYPKICTGSQN